MCRRVFHQGSTDHRGTPNHPGRTATLESAANCVTWGTAFRLAGSFEEQLETLQVWLTGSRRRRRATSSLRR